MFWIGFAYIASSSPYREQENPLLSSHAGCICIWSAMGLRTGHALVILVRVWTVKLLHCHIRLASNVDVGVIKMSI